MFYSFSSATNSYAGDSASGGAAEVAINPGSATVTLHGARGVRRLAIPGAWLVASPAGVSAPGPQSTALTVNYDSDSPVTLKLQ